MNILASRQKERIPVTRTLKFVKCVNQILAGIKNYPTYVYGIATEAPDYTHSRAQYVDPAQHTVAQYI